MPMSSRPPAVYVDDVAKSFSIPRERVHTLKERVLHPLRQAAHDEFEALRGVSFSVEPGEFYGIVGRNGSGKSTLLKCLAGIYRTDRGAIYIDGRVSTFIELGVGFNPDLAAFDNVMLNATMLGLSTKEARQRYDRIIDFAELHDFTDLKIKNYSSGMLVRLAFSVMIQVDADILLIDEVLAVGDASFQQKCFDQFNRLRDAGQTIVLVTHDMGAVRRFCHRAMLMERGVVVGAGDPALVGEQYLELNFRRDVAEGVVKPPPDDRFGDGSARFTQLWIQTPRDEPLEVAPQGEDFVIRATVEFLEAIEDPAVGLLIETADHQPVFATSSIWTQERTGSFAAGDVARLSVQLPNVLAPGRYFVT